MRSEFSASGTYGLGLIIPAPPVLPDPERPVVQVYFGYEQLKEYRMQSCHHVVRANYVMVQRMIEDRILEEYERNYLDWLEWVTVSL
jgi:hypothetical protein